MKKIYIVIFVNLLFSLITFCMVLYIFFGPYKNNSSIGSISNNSEISGVNLIDKTNTKLQINDEKVIKQTQITNILTDDKLNSELDKIKNNFLACKEYQFAGGVKNIKFISIANSKKGCSVMFQKMDEYEKNYNCLFDSKDLNIDLLNAILGGDLKNNLVISKCN